MSTEMDGAWRRKAHRLIYDLCFESWRAANVLPNGQRRRRHRPYRVPVLAETLVECLDRDDEAAAKAIFLQFEYLRQVS